MYKTIVLLMILCCTISVFGQNFRDAYWGMTSSTVEKIEDEQLLSEEDNNLVYSGEIAGYDALIMYEFTNDKLSLAMYAFPEVHKELDLYFEDYRKFNDLLKKKYGEPQNEQKIWKDDMFKDGPNGMGISLLFGYVMYSTVWETEETRIEHILSGGGDEISHLICYEALNTGVKKKGEEVLGDL